VIWTGSPPQNPFGLEERVIAFVAIARLEVGVFVVVLKLKELKIWCTDAVVVDQVKRL
jgi:hypothetical protein